MNILTWIVFGLIVGAIAKFLMPGKDPGGIIVTILLGIAGSVVGGFIGQALGLYAQGQWAGWILSIAGAMVLLLIYRMVVGKKK
ncbi:MAG: GlsB/YeaQ/YmgE family stress response membrane protein [Acidobacteriota bacterium]